MSNTPKLRFKNENGENYPGWETTSIEKIACVEKGFTPSTKDYSLWNGDIPWLSISDMKQGKYIRNTSKTISDLGLGNKKVTPKGTLIMSFKLTLGKMAILDKDTVTNEAICHFYWKNKNIDTEFMYYNMSNINIASFGSRAAKGITLNNDSINSITVRVPSFPEQEKIASFFSLIDDKISLQSEKVEALKDYKKGIMQKIFSQELRFKDENREEYPEWEEKYLQALCNIKKGTQLNKLNLLEYGDYYVINGGIGHSGYTDKYNTNENTISISEGGNSCGYINFNKKKFWSGGHCYTLENLKDVNAKFLYQILKYNQNEIMRLRVGSGLPNIQKKDLELYILKIPVPQEQEKIALLLSTIDKKIELEQEKLEQLQEYKKGLLQQMFV